MWCYLDNLLPGQWAMLICQTRDPLIKSKMVKLNFWLQHDIPKGKKAVCVALPRLVQFLNNLEKVIVYKRIPPLILPISDFFSLSNFWTFSNTTKMHFKQFFGILNAYVLFSVKLFKSMFLLHFVNIPVESHNQKSTFFSFEGF